MKQVLLGLGIALGLSIGVSAQPQRSKDLTSATCTSDASSGCLYVDTSGLAALGVQITNTFVATVQFEQTMETVAAPTFVSLPMTPCAGGADVTSATAPGCWKASVTTKNARIRVSAYTSGTVSVSTIATVSSRGGGGSSGTTLTDSASLASALSDETGTGLAVFNSSPTIVTPTIASFTNATHNHSNAAGGGTLAEAALALTDVTTANATSSAHGFMPKLSGNAFDFALGDGSYGRTLARGTITASSPWTFTQTLNDNFVDFFTFDINITNTAASSASRAFRILKAGTEEFSIRGGDGLVNAQLVSIASNLTVPTININVGGLVQFSDGTDFAGSLHRVTGGGGGLRVGNGSTGFNELQAQDVRLVPNGVAKPTCAAGIRGTHWYVPGGAGVADTSEICSKSSLDVYAWRATATIP